MAQQRSALSILRATQAEVYAAFKADNVPRTQLLAWCEEHCGRWNVDAKRLRTWVVNSIQDELALAKLESHTDAQKIAHSLGATFSAALGVDVEALEATKVRPVVNRQGEIVDKIETPDWEVRLAASKEIKKVLGAYAVEKLEIMAGPLDVYGKMTEEQLKRELESLRSRQGNGDSPASVGHGGGKERLLLADGGDVDEGRAGSAESVQAVPASSVFQANPQRFRQ